MEAARKAVELGGGYDDEAALEVLARTLLVTEEFDSAEAEMRRLWDRGVRPYRAGLAEIMRYRGKRNEAYRLLDQMERTASPDARLFRVRHAAGDGNAVLLREAARRATPDVDVPLVALSLAVAGEAEEAGRLLQDHPIDQVDLYGVHGRVIAQDVVTALRARGRGDGVGGRQMLDAARSRALFKDERVLDYFIGETCHMAGDDRCAVQAFADGRRFIWGGFLPGVIAYPRSLYMLALSMHRLGRHDEARHVAEKLVALWKDADPDLPLLAEARALCGRVGCAVP
jgi:hypothetical protein